MLTYFCFPSVGLESQLQFIFLCRSCVCGFRNLEGEGKKEEREREGEIRKEDKGGGRRGKGGRGGEMWRGSGGGGGRKKKREEGKEGKE